MDKWTKTWPTEPGMYWFYGWPFGEKSHKPELNLVRLWAVSNGVIMIRDGTSWFKNEGGIGMFCEVKLPDLPIL